MSAGVQQRPLKPPPGQSPLVSRSECCLIGLGPCHVFPIFKEVIVEKGQKAGHTELVELYEGT